MRIKEKSRTEYSAQNTMAAMVSKVAAILLGFVTRVIFTHTLNETYVGINGLFTVVLNLLSLQELGVGLAITYTLYKPVAEGDIEKQKSLMQYYCKFYRVMAAAVTAIGLLIIPFMDILVSEENRIAHLIPIYLMYLASTVLSYLFVYKRTLLEAHQLTYVGAIYRSVFLVVQNILQSAVLLLTGNFILFLVIYILSVLIGNLCISHEADKRYPYLREKDIQPLDKTEKKQIFQNIKAMLMHKAGNVAVNNTANLLLSAMAGVISVGCYSNYYLIIGSVRQVLDETFQALTASVGNLGATEDTGRVTKIFKCTFFAVQWAYGLAAICLYELLNPFVEISFGRNYLFAMPVVLILCVNFYVTGMRRAVLVFRDSFGLFLNDRYKAVAEVLINLAASIILGYYFGAAGIFLGTLISTVCTSLWIEPYTFYKHQLHQSVLSYFAKYGLYAGVTTGVWLLTDFVCRMITGSPWAVLFGRAAVCVVIPNVIWLLLYGRTAEFTFLLGKVWGLVQSKIRKGK